MRGVGALLAIALSATTAGCSDAGRPAAEGVDAIQHELETTGSAIVSVVLAETLTPRSANSLQRVRAAQADIAASLTAPGSGVLHAFRTTAGMSVRIGSTADLEALANDPRVAKVDLAISGTGGLNQSRGIVGADAAYANGYDGAGRTVAILDSGIDRTHPDLSNDVVAEACVCNTVIDGRACCPNGSNYQVGTGSAPDDAGHGTHVAGIVTSTGSVAPRGIAPNAKTVMVRMMHQNSFSSTDDIAAALEWVLDNHPNVDAVNLSLQTGDLFPADCDVARTGYTPPAYLTNLGNVVRSLVDAGISVVSITGNHWNKSLISAPGCLQHAIAVGNTRKDNTINEQSNSNAGLDILAPGTSIVSTIVGGSSGAFSGTSMAAPHVAGAIALLRESNSSLSPSAMRACLSASPTVLTDTNGIARPLLNIPSAITACAGTTAPQSFQAENAVFYRSVVESQHAGYTGTGYVNPDNSSGTYIEWTVTAPRAGTFPLSFRFANGTTTARTVRVQVNGVTVQSNFSFPGTGAWSSWSTTPLSAALVAGTNRIRLTSTSATGGPNYDRLDVTF